MSNYYGVSFCFTSVEAMRNVSNPSFHIAASLKRIPNIALKHDDLDVDSKFKFVRSDLSGDELIEVINQALPETLTVHQVWGDDSSARRAFGGG